MEVKAAEVKTAELRAAELRAAKTTYPIESKLVEVRLQTTVEMMQAQRDREDAMRLREDDIREKLRIQELALAAARQERDDRLRREDDAKYSERDGRMFELLGKYAPK